MQARHGRLAPRSAAIAVAVALALGFAHPAIAADSRHDDAHPGSELVLRALALLGVNYRWGGNSPDTGLDCSGLVRHVFQETIGLVLPRRAEEMSRAGDAIRRDQLRPGDLVFFNTLRRAFSHVGIYIGDGRFVHAPANGGQVRVENLGGRYWQQRFNGARRMLATADAMASRPPRQAPYATPDVYGTRVAAQERLLSPYALPPNAAMPAAGARVERWVDRLQDNPYIN